MNCKSIQWMIALVLCLGAAQSVSAEFLYEVGPMYRGRLVAGQWKKAWTESLTAGINASNLLSHREKQIENMCPGYGNSSSKRMLFWQQLMISLSYKESLHGPRNYVHFNGGVNNGLFQINPVLRDAYGCGKIDLFNAINNIRCGVKMAAKLVGQFGSFLKGAKGGMAAYWQPLRATTKANTKNRNYILSAVKGACKNNSLVYHSTTRPTALDGTVLADADLTVNTLEDLGLPESAREPASAADEFPYDPPTFTFDAESGLMFDLIPEGN